MVNQLRQYAFSGPTIFSLETNISFGPLCPMTASGPSSRLSKTLSECLRCPWTARPWKHPSPSKLVVWGCRSTLANNRCSPVAKALPKRWWIISMLLMIVARRSTRQISLATPLLSGREFRKDQHWR